jgi:alkanesulfonate monooxygenase SsuD/methylene tetrahydromethanopterin reductase-like flavin-dependent oxidoreductase (luciferase family)
VLDPEQFVPGPNLLQGLGMTPGLVDLPRHERLTARHAVRCFEGHHRLVLGTPKDVAGGTVDGDTIYPPRVPDGIADFVGKMISILRDRGVFHRDYEIGTVRDRYSLPYPD